MDTLNLGVSIKIRRINIAFERDLEIPQKLGKSIKHEVFPENYLNFVPPIKRTFLILLDRLLVKINQKYGDFIKVSPSSAVPNFHLTCILAISLN